MSERRRKEIFDCCVPILEEIRRKFYTEDVQMALIAVDPSDVSTVNVISGLAPETLIEALRTAKEKDDHE